MAVVVGLGHPCGGGCRGRASLMAVVVGLGHPCGGGCRARASLWRWL